MAIDVVDVVAEAYDADGPLSFRERVLRRLVGSFGADSAVFLRIADGKVSGPHGFLNKDRYQHLAMAYASQVDRHQRFQKKMWGSLAAGRGACIDTRVFTARERDALPFYAEIARPQGIRSQLVLGLGIRGQRVGAIYLCRHGRGRDFTDRDLDAARPLIPALAIAQRATDAAVVAAGPALASLTPRQREIARHVAAGLSNAEIATVLGCSPNTVRNHLAAIFDALGVETRTRLALLVSRIPTPT